MEIFAFSASGLARVTPKGITAIGGSAGSGIKVPGLRHSDDYAVVGPGENGYFLHSIRGKKMGRVELTKNKVVAVDDLFLCAVDSLPQSHKVPALNAGMQDLLSHFSAAENLEPTLVWFLRHLIELAEMEKGLLITRTAEGVYQAQVKEGLKSGDPWLTEALVQETLTSGKPQWIQNRMGSQFDGSKSLVAAGFLSVFSLPLVARGEVLGAVIVGSSRPHSGLEEEQREHIQTLARLLALFFWFHRRDLLSQLEIKRLSQNQVSREDFPIQTSSPRLLAELGVAKRLAGTNLSVLVRGETGTGKEVIAQWIHRQSERKSGAFVAINCAAIPADLLESILFGHKKGSFTGATSDQAGKFLLAHGGTLLLDEIGDLPERLQAKLLRVLQEGTIDPIGATKSLKIDVRVVAATHRDLLELVKAGRFREDLYYRIAETQIFLPPLRERPEDIALLVVHFLAEVSPRKRISPSALDWLGALPWPGNVRELRSAVRRAAALAQGEELTKADFQTGLPAPLATQDHWLGGENLEEAKQAFIMEKVHLALARAKGNRQKAADLLGVTSRTLFRYLEGEKADKPFTTHDINVIPKQGDFEKNHVDSAT